MRKRKTIQFYEKSINYSYISQYDVPRKVNANYFDDELEQSFIGNKLTTDQYKKN